MGVIDEEEFERFEEEKNLANLKHLINRPDIREDMKKTSEEMEKEGKNLRHIREIQYFDSVAKDFPYLLNTEEEHEEDSKETGEHKEIENRVLEKADAIEQTIYPTTEKRRKKKKKKIPAPKTTPQPTSSSTKIPGFRGPKRTQKPKQNRHEKMPPKPKMQMA